LHAPTRFRRYGRCRILFSRFARPDAFFIGTEGIRSRFHVLPSRTCFRRCRVRQVMFSCFVRPDSFSVVPRATGPVFMFCAPGLVFGGTEGVTSCIHVWHSIHVFGGTEGVVFSFHVFRSRSCFRWYRGHKVPFSCFARPDSFSAILRALGPVFTFCASGLVFVGTEGIGSRFHVLPSRARFWRYVGPSVLFSSFALQDIFSAVPSASCPVFMFCAP
jgi:hypothetical protein